MKKAMANPTAIPPSTTRKKSPIASPMENCPVSTAARAKRNTIRLEASLIRLSPSRIVVMRSGTLIFLKIEVAATASGGLSKKQLEGLHKKAVKVRTIPVNWLATLEAVILKKPTRYKSQAPAPKPFYEEKNSAHGEMIGAVLAKYPEHKRVLFFKLKYEKNEALSPLEISELEKFHKIVKDKEGKS